MNGKTPRQRTCVNGAPLNIVEAMDHPGLFRQWFQGESWANWRAILKAAFCLPMSEAERMFFRSVAEREPPTRRVRELWVSGGRRGGKDSIASLIIAHAAVFFRAGFDRLRAGERALIQCVAVDREQAKIVLGYTQSYFDHIPPLREMVTRRTATGFELINDVEVSVVTNSFRSLRGRTVLCSIFDEVAFWQSDASARPDIETYNAVLPGMATLPGSMLIAISSPYRRSGLLWTKYRKHYSRDDDDVLVIKAPSTALNPTLDQTIIDQALADDPSAARADWLAEFRTDIESFVNPEAIDAVIVSGRYELQPVSGVSYTAFVDPSGGSSDSMTLAVAHRDSASRAILDAIRECKPPFSPENVVNEFAGLLKTYGVRKVTGDHWGGEFVREPFRSHGIQYELAEKPKSDIYRDLLPILNSGKAELLDHPRLVAQLCGLERRTARSGRDSIDHAPGAHDDIANSVAGALLMASGEHCVIVTPELLARAAAMPRRRDFGSGRSPAMFLPTNWN